MKSRRKQNNKCMIKHKFSTLLVALCATTALWASNNVITYTAPTKLPESEYYPYASSVDGGLHTNCFNTTIKSHTFQDGIGTIEFFNAVTEIGHFAFAWSDITSINLPNTVSSIGEYAFDGCDLKTFTVPEAVTYLDSWSFSCCFQLESVTFNKSLKTIGLRAFESCTKLTTVELPNSLVTIYNMAFVGCINLESVTFGKSLQSIGYQAFESCYKLKSIVLPNSLITIGEAAFDNCSNLNSVKMGNSVETIGPHAFNWCGKLSEINLSSSLKTIGSYAFYVTNLSSIILPASLTNINSGAFGECDFTSIICLASTPPTCGSSCFSSHMRSSGILYVPAESVEAYRAAEQWGKITDVRPITAKEVEVTEIEAEPTESAVEIAWPSVVNAETYTIEIRNEDKLVCTLVFNADGQLLSITYAAPARGGERTSSNAEMTGNGYRFTVTGLEAGTDYTYSITAKSASQQILETYSGEFTTNAPTGIGDLQVQKTKTKFIRNNQLHIFRNGKLYNAMGGVMR